MNNHNLSKYHCDHCGREFIIAEIGDIKYCPYCGDMDVVRYGYTSVAID